MNKSNIAIIGSGQAGLQLAIHLLKSRHFNISLFSERTAEQIFNGRILSSQVMFDDALQAERAIGLNFWDDEAPKNTTVSCAVGMPGAPKPELYWQGQVKPFQSIDQRLKFSRWLEEFEKLGGDLIIKEVNLDDLDFISEQHDLTIVATGKGKLSQQFAIDKTRSPYTTPQRALACLYVKGMQPTSTGVRGNIIPGIGEYFTTPGLTHNGHCEMMLFEGLPGGAWDCWQNNSSPQEILQQANNLLKQYVPWEAERCENIELSDENAVLVGRYTPLVRKPVASLANGKFIAGIADAIVLNDPIAGQGANHAAKVAYFYAKNILEKNHDGFDKSWIEKIAETAWIKFGDPATQLSSLLLAPPSPHFLKVLSSAMHDKHVANQLAEGFNNPSTLNWLTESQNAHSELTVEA